jgi:hypothetical protein
MIAAPVRLYGLTAWQELAGVLKEDDPVAQETPALIEVVHNGTSGIAIWCGGRWAMWCMRTPAFWQLGM